MVPSRVSVLLLGLCAPLWVAGCADESDGDGAGGSAGSSKAGHSSGGGGAGAMAGTSGSGGSVSEAGGPCRVGSVTDAAPLFTQFAGSYVYVPFSSTCTIGEAMLQKDQPYTATLSDAPQSLEVEVDASTTLEFTWDGEGDVACADDFTSTIEIDGHGAFARISFLNLDGDPVGLVLGTCGLKAE